MITSFYYIRRSTIRRFDHRSLTNRLFNDSTTILPVHYFRLFDDSITTRTYHHSTIHWFDGSTIPPCSTIRRFDDSTIPLIHIRLFDDSTRQPFDNIRAIRRFNHTTIRLFDDSTITPFDYIRRFENRRGHFSTVWRFGDNTIRLYIRAIRRIDNSTIPVEPHSTNYKCCSIALSISAGTHSALKELRVPPFVLKVLLP